MTTPTTCPDCGLKDQRDQFCRYCNQHFGPNTNRPCPDDEPREPDPDEGERVIYKPVYPPEGR